MNSEADIVQRRSNYRQTLSNSSQTIVRGQETPLSVFPGRFLSGECRFLLRKHLDSPYHSKYFECVSRSGTQCLYILAITSFLESKQKPLDSRFKHSGTTERKATAGDDGDFEPPRPLAAILRDAKRAISPAMGLANSPQPRGCKFPAPAPCPYDRLTTV